jgi:transposase-like protein
LLDAGEKPAADLARELGVRRNQLYKEERDILKKAAAYFAKELK